MTNLNDLFQRDMAFRSIVIEAAARAIGSTSEDFAEEWLMHESCAQHADRREPEKVDGGESYDSREFAANRQTSRFDAPESEETAEIATTKCDIRDFDADVARLTAERDGLAADLADAMKQLRIAEGEIKTQRNNFDQVQGSRDYWREKLSILLARLRDMGCKTGSINDLPIEIELPHGDGDEGMA